MIVSPRRFASDYCSNAKDASTSVPRRQNTLIPRERQTVKRRKRKEDPPAIAVQKGIRGVGGGRSRRLFLLHHSMADETVSFRNRADSRWVRNQWKSSLLQNNEL